MAILLAVALFILLPSVYMDDLMQGAISGKTFFFLYAILVTGTLLCIIQVITHIPVCIRFTPIDGALLLWVFYILLNGLFKHTPLSYRLLDLTGLTGFYILLRRISPSQYGLLLIAMMIGGTVQAIHGNLQLWGYFQSHHSLFRMTGSFFNPGPFAGYLAAVFPAALGVYIFRINPFSSLKFPVANLIAGITLLLLLVTLPSLGSRAAWLAVVASSVTLCILRYPVTQWLKKLPSPKRGAMLLTVCILIGAGCFGLLRLKTDSAGGRMLIWKVTSSMITHHSITGVGFDRFKAFYMDEQARYLGQMPESSEAMIAGDTNYAFNEFLQHTAENGLIGLLLIIVALGYSFSVNNRDFTSLSGIAKAGIVGISVFALFSYPAEVLPIKMCATAYLACLSTFAKGKTWKINRGKHFFLKSVLVIFIVIAGIAGIRSIDRYHRTWENWETGYRLYTRGYYAESLNVYAQAWSTLKTNGEYLTHYGKALNVAGQHEEAIRTLQQATLYFPNTIVYTALGDSYKALGKNSTAEQSYIHARHMIPSRFYPLYLLAKLYDETGQTEKAAAMALELINKKVKVNSTAIKEIRTEMEKLLKKYQGATVGFKLQKWKPPKGGGKERLDMSIICSMIGIT
jgi:tetratricopeptide (TPR) repeat protein